MADATQPENDGTLVAARMSAHAWSLRAKATNTREVLPLGGARLVRLGVTGMGFRCCRPP